MSKLALLRKELHVLNFGSGRGRSCSSSDYDCKFSNYRNILNAVSKWLRQEDTTYVVVHGMRIGEYEAAFREVVSFMFVLMVCTRIVCPKQQGNPRSEPEATWYRDKVSVVVLRQSSCLDTTSLQAPASDFLILLSIGS
ncbi:hypothetical protein QYF36_000438 [Acer negundo]|nr:hypothetical protein QYF36_000438 [Acer negundo]